MVLGSSTPRFVAKVLVKIVPQLSFTLRSFRRPVGASSMAPNNTVLAATKVHRSRLAAAIGFFASSSSIPHPTTPVRDLSVDESESGTRLVVRCYLQLPLERIVETYAVSHVLEL